MGWKCFCLVFTATFIYGCSSTERGAALPVGSPCDQDHECAGPGTPVCLDEFKPLADIIDPNADPDQKAFFENIGFDFPGGYCSTLENCHEDSECGEGGECFWALKNVDDQTLQSLQDTGLPFDIFAFADMGLCMRRCQSDEECRDGYACAIPLESFLVLVSGSSDETFCVPIDPCYPDPCENGTCSKVEGDVYSCECDPGYTGDNCEINIDDCDPNPCLNGGTCTDGVDAYVCQCPTGYTGDNCETEVVGCDPNPCLNGGTCQEVAGGYQCNCPAGYTGDHCETDIDDCDPDPCQNGGTCVDGVDSYTCQCPAGFTGDNCEINIDDCATNPCLNGGTCVDGVDSYNCQCVAGYTGTNCETNIDDCDPDPCLNGGTCIDGVDSYTCQCPPGYTGTNCEIEVTGCDPNPCQNGGTCTDEGGGAYSCQCQPGYTGTHCETNIDDCASSPCLNGGLCVDGVDSYTCQCQPGYTGDDCEIDIDECAGNPCQNGGICVDGVNSYTCQCQPGYTGTNCENLVDCGDPPQILDGDVSYTATTYGSTATYTCLPGSVIDPPGGETIACQADGDWETPPSCVAQAQVHNPGPVVFSFPVAVMDFTDTTGFDFDTTGNPECSDGANNDDFTAAGEGIQDSLIDFPDDPECSEAADDSENKSDYQEQITLTLTGTIDADGNINIPQADVVIPPVYGYSEQLGGDHVSLNTFLPTHDATGTLDPATGEVSIRIRFRLRFQGGTSAFDGPGDNCYIGTTSEPIDITLTSGTSTSAEGKPDLTGVAYEATGGTLSLVGYNTADIPGAATCGFLGFGNGAINEAFGTPSGPGHTGMEVSGSTTPVLIIP